jgi:predicted nucleic acid-binding protein
VKLVLDASVWLKWLIADPIKEPDTDRAVVLIKACLAGEHDLLEPPHWLAEVAAVLARLSPNTAVRDVLALRALELPIADDPKVWSRAAQLAIDLKQHVFDTLYHAVALESASTLVTADDRYRLRARKMARVKSLGDVV